MKPNVKTNRFAWGVGLAAGCGLMFLAGVAKADTCQSLLGGTKKLFVMTGSSAIEPTLGALAVKLADKYLIAYQPTGSGRGATDIFSHAADPAMGTLNPSDTTHYFVADATKSTGAATMSCTLDPADTASMFAQIGVSDVFPTNFSGVTESLITEKKVQVKTGPVQAMLFVVPKDSSATAISAPQAHALFGGCTTSALPWTDTYDRGAGSGTQVMIAKYIATPLTFMGPVTQPGNHGLGGSALINALKAISGAEAATKAIGITSGDTYEGQRGSLKQLAFQAYNQTAAYYMDSTAASSDRRNVRDGHYVIQGPVYFSLAGTPSAEATEVINVLTGAAPLVAGETDNRSYIQWVSKAGMIPECAMKVARKSEGGRLAPFTPAKACGCYFETFVPGATGTPAGCVACDGATPCANGKACNYGFCE